MIIKDKEKKLFNWNYLIKKIFNWNLNMDIRLVNNIIKIINFSIFLVILRLCMRIFIVDR